MSKELTEKWKNETIDTSHHYYVRVIGREDRGCGGIDFIDIVRPPLFSDLEDKLWEYNNPDVLCEVPSYDEYNGLLEQIKKQGLLIKRLQEQIEKANEAIDEAYWDCYNEGFEPELATEYRKKYGLNANDDKYK